MTTVARLVGERLACDRCAYAEADADEDHFTMTGSYARGLPPLTGRMALSDFSAETLRCMRAGEPYVADAFTDARVLPVSWPRTWSSSSVRPARTPRSTRTRRPRRGSSSTRSRGARTATSRSPSRPRPLASGAGGQRSPRTRAAGDRRDRRGPADRLRPRRHPRAVFELGQLVPRQRGLLDAAAPFLTDLFEATLETVHLRCPTGVGGGAGAGGVECRRHLRRRPGARRGRCGGGCHLDHGVDQAARRTGWRPRCGRRRWACRGSCGEARLTDGNGPNGTTVPGRRDKRGILGEAGC